MSADLASVSALAIVFGLAFGSFANVVIWRFPRGESLSTPGSHCPACDSPVRWYDNVPLISWVALRGRCRDCDSRIHWRYPAVESLTALLWVVAVLQFGVTYRAAFAAVMFYLLVILAFIDLDVRRLPNPIVVLLGGVGLVGCVISQFTRVDMLPLITVGGVFESPLAAAFIGSVSAGGITLAIAMLYSQMRGRAGLGMGDVKLLFALGPYLGAYTVGVLVVGSFLGTLWGLVAASQSGEGGSTKFAFGPCLSAAAVIVAVFGPQVWGWYAGLVGLA